MSDPVLIAIVTGMFGILAALIARNNHSTKKIRSQIENNHIEPEHKISNIRENIDHNQNEVIQRLDRITESLENTNDTVRRQGNKIDRLFSITSKQTDIIGKLGKK